MVVVWWLGGFVFCWVGEVVCWCCVVYALVLVVWLWEIRCFVCLKIY